MPARLVLFHNSPKRSASGVSIAVMVGAICLSITDALGYPGALAFLIGFGVSMLILTTLAQLARTEPVAKIGPSEGKDVSRAELEAMSLYLEAMLKRIGSAEWK